MKGLRAAILAACLPLTANAAPVELYRFELGDVVAHLQDSPCENQKVRTVLQDLDGFRAADVEWQGKSYAACWAVVDEQVVVVDETGDAGFLQPEGFSNGRTPVSLKLRGA